MSFHFAGLGTSLPEGILTQEEATTIAMERCLGGSDMTERLRLFFRRSGVKQRQLVIVEGRNGHGPETPFFPEPVNQCDHGPTTGARMRQYEERALSLSLAAMRSALTAAPLDPQQITHLITVSCSGFAAPGVDVGLIAKLGLRPTVERVHIGFMGCHGAINGLRVADAIARADSEATIGLCCVELCSLHFQYEADPQRLIANALFSDGAAAVIGGANLERGRTSSTWRIAATGSCLIADSERAMSWRIGDHGFVMTLAPEAPDLIQSRLRPWLSEWLGQHGLRLGDVRLWAVHPGGPKVLAAVETALDLSPHALDVSRDVLAECGNMSSATVLFIFDRLRRAADTRGPCVMLAFGPGLTAEAALLTDTR